MRAIRKADPTFTHYVPRTAVEAVDRYVRCRKNGLRAVMVPECLIECAAGLPPAELDLGDLAGPPDLHGQAQDEDRRAAGT